MSAAQTQSDSEQRWGCLESLGLSPRELVLAEALQMEYDALSRLKQDKGPGGSRTSESSKSTPTRTERPLPRPVPSPPGSNLLPGLSGSDPMLNLIQPGVSNPSRPFYSKEPLYILENQGKQDYEGTSRMMSKGLPPPDEPPPAVPPRNPIPQPDSFMARRGSAPRDVNLFTPEVDQPKLPSGDTMNYDNLNDSLMRLNGDWPSPRGRRVNGDQSGKPVARSKTLPPQVPPRTYIPGQMSCRSNRRVSADPVSLGSRLNGFGYELFQVSEERDEEVAAFCHMLDVLRSAYPCSERSKNAGFVWSPSVAQEELQQGLGVSIKVTVVSEHFREPLTFTCDVFSSCKEK